MEGEARRPLSVAEAKANLRATADQCDPFGWVTAHPIATAAVAGTLGYILLRSGKLSDILKQSVPWLLKTGMRFMS